MTDDETTDSHLWAPWTGDGTLHLLPPVESDAAARELGACATWSVDGLTLRGPTLDLDQARHLGHHPPGATCCRRCVEVALADRALAGRDAGGVAAAYRIRAELVCCDSYDVCRPSALTEDDPDYDPATHPAYHSLCYWGEAAARLAECSEDCEHDSGSYFDRTVCADPCGTMHDRCRDCGAPLGSCPHRFTGAALLGVATPPAYLTRYPEVTADRIAECAGEWGNAGRESIKSLAAEWLAEAESGPKEQRSE